VGKILAIDMGTKRVGIAISDALQMISTPLTIIQFTGMDELVRQIKELAIKNNVAKVIIGLPIREDGTEGPGCVISKNMGDKLRDVGLETVLWDERYSSKIAEYYLRECGIKHKDTKDKLDSLSASVLLESYLQYSNK
jgi:putative Holliday junction resolvase